jgi:hypothetical protein
MHSKLVVALAVGGAIAIGGTAGAAVAGRDTTSTSTPSTSTSPVTTPDTTPDTTPGSAVPGPQTVTIGDVGTLTATVGADGALLDVLVLPAPGFVVTGPFETSEGLMVTLTGPDGVAQTFEIEVSDGEIEIRPETGVGGIGDDRFDDDPFDDRGRNRGPGNGGDRDEDGSDDNSGPGSGDHDNSGPGSGDDDSGSDSSGPGSGGDADDSGGSGSGHSGSAD